MKIRLIKVRSYSGYGVTATVKKPAVDVDTATGRILISTGYFAEDESPDGEYNKPEEPEYTAAGIAKMKKDELIAFAQEHNINMEGCSNQDERIERVKGALGLVDFAMSGFED